MREGDAEPSETPDPRPVTGPWGFSQAEEPSHGRALYFVAGLLMSICIALGQQWLRAQYYSGRSTRPVRRVLVGLLLAAIVWAVIQRRRHGRRYHPVWLAWGVVGGLLGWAIVFKPHWF